MDAAGRIIRVAKPWTIRRWSESKQANGEPLVKVPKEEAHLINPEWTVQEQATLQQLVARYKSQGEGGAWRVHRWRLACFPVVLGDRHRMSLEQHAREKALYISLSVGARRQRLAIPDNCG
ncbi:hypothetical protein K440DRAFT_645299 [Wilcoxina mikolae CBS 423.85]|nr:hypothetical protein K440DRAFT_645299 [Wilcoxina mikolae CBS 423.85]